LSGIGFVIALPREIPAGFVRIPSREAGKSCASAVYQHATTAAQLVAVQAGIGCTRAAEGARLLIQRFSPQALVSCGFAGGLMPQLVRGTVIIGTELVGTESSRTLAKANRHLVDQFLVATEAAGLPGQRGTIVTTQHLVADARSKAQLRGKSGACAVDMETAGIVAVAGEAGLPWVAVRAILDSAEDALPAACLTTLRDDGHVAMWRLIQLMCRSPWLLRHLVRLAGDTATARRHLSQAVERWARTSAGQGDHERG
jgi:adenosylhomocysteine nucleosidase